MQKGEQGGLSVELVGLLLMSTPAGPAVAKGGNLLWFTFLSTDNPLWGGKLTSLFGGSSGTVSQGVNAGQSAASNEAGGILRKICGYVHCTNAANLKNDGNWLQSGDLSSALGISKDSVLHDYISNLNQPDPSNSIIMSIKTQCWPGVIYNLNKYRQIDCGYIQCLKDNAYYGDSVTPCELGKGVKLCRFVTSEAFELPYVNIFKNLAANLNRVIQAPLSLLLRNLVQSKVCAPATDHEITYKGFACQLMKTMLKQRDFQSVTQSNQVFSYPTTADLCDQALCTGDQCSHPTKSYIEQLLPGSRLPGDLGRQQAVQTRDNKNLAQNLSHDLVQGWDGSKPLTDSMNQYKQQNNMNDAQAQAFFTSISKGCTKDCGKDLFNLITQGNQPTNYADYNLLVRGKLGPEVVNAYQSFSAFTNKASSFTCNQNDINKCQVTCDVKNPDCLTLKRNLDSWQASLKKGGRTACQGADGQWNLCPAGTDCSKPINCEPQTIANAEAASQAEKAKYEKQLQFYSWVDKLGTVAYGYLRERGQLDALFLSGWGSWGKQVSTTAAEYLDPEQWKNNLCNPNGAFSDYTDESGSVYTFQAQTYRAVLTFAAEILPVEGRYLYTVSVTAVSPNSDNTLRVTLEPGNHAVLTNVTMAKGAQIQLGTVVNDTAVYKQVCVSFTQPFPDPGKQSRYCRTIQPNAFNRGDPTNGTMPDFGVTNPYQNAPKTTLPGGGT
jgi:hypothetical protein